MKVYPKIIEKSIEEYKRDVFLRNFHREASKVETEGYGVWPRIREVIELCRKLNLKRIGLAFCIGLSSEAQKLCEILESWGLEVYSVCCKCGSIDKTEIGLKEEEKRKPRIHEAICNPVAQAMLLNAAKTEINLIFGLCVGHDSIFIRYSKAPVICLVAKDRTTGHNPLVAIYAYHYFSKRLMP